MERVFNVPNTKTSEVVRKLITLSWSLYIEQNGSKILHHTPKCIIPLYKEKTSK